MRKICTLIVFAFLLWLVPAELSAQPGEKPNFPTIELWAGGAPGATGSSEEDRPALIPFLPDAGKNTGTAILICPGGGFMTRATDHEGILVAQWLKERGIASFILRYRIRPLYTRKDSDADGQRAMQYIRSHAAEFKLSPDRIGVIGFSAGAELASDITFQTQPGRPDAADAVERAASRPNFLMLIYGSAPLQASEGGNAPQLPPTFMFCTAEDYGHLRGMLDLYGNLLKAKVPVEAHFFVNGEHGVGLAQGDPVLGAWPELMHNWMLAGGWLTGEPRVALKGLVKLDGEPLNRGVVILTPVDKLGAPPVVAYITNTGPVLGQFTMAQNQGPVAGRYRVEVRQDATRWMSNGRNPVMLKMTQKMRSGGLTEEDRKEWNEYARKRDLSPSIDRQRVFRRQHPQDKSDLIVEIKGGENQLTIEVFSR